MDTSAFESEVEFVETVSSAEEADEALDVVDRGCLCVVAQTSSVDAV